MINHIAGTGIGANEIFVQPVGSLSDPYRSLRYRFATKTSFPPVLHWRGIRPLKRIHGIQTSDTSLQNRGDNQTIPPVLDAPC